MKAKDPDIDLVWLKERIHYDPFSGHLFWLPGTIAYRNRKTHLCPIIGTTQKGYIRFNSEINGKMKALMAHRVAWLLFYGVWPVGQVDHINSIKNDNRINNLRECTQSQNQANRDKPSLGKKSKYKGVSRSDFSWVAHAKGKHIGSFKTETEAAEAYNERALEEYGEFSRLNAIES